jgi:hypothetical protein
VRQDAQELSGQANTIKFVKLNPHVSQRVAKRSFQFWFAGIIFSLINGVLKVAKSKFPAVLESNLILF